LLALRADFVCGIRRRLLGLPRGIAFRYIAVSEHGISGSRMNTIAVFLPNWIGDAVMATPALRALRRHYASARLIGVVKPYVAGVFEGAPWFDRLVLLDKLGPWSLRWPMVALTLRHPQPDLAVLFPNTFRSALAAMLAGCRRRVGFRRHGRGCLLTDVLEPVRDANGRRVPSPILDDYNRLAAQVGCPDPGHRMELFTTQTDEAGADRVWREGGFDDCAEVVCLNPGAAFGSAKLWSAESFARLSQLLVDERGCGVLVLCGPAERALADQIVHLAERSAVRSLAGQALSLGLTKACVRRADLLVTTDSGPRHFAAAFGRPVVTLFGPTYIAWTETYQPSAIHLQKQVDCGPCQRRVCPLDHRCMTRISPDEVFASARRLLTRAPHRKAS
jgi:heptosyltransferase-2